MQPLFRFEWDERKAESNFDKHRLSFPYATRVFLDPERVEIDASREQDGEARFTAIGMIDDKLYVVVATGRGSVQRIISARRANRAEERAYGHR